MQSQLLAATRMALLGTVGAMCEDARATPGGTGDIAFELERFEFKGDDRSRSSGRWFGVRGRRFIRPTLTRHHRRTRVPGLADLEHKPWAPGGRQAVDGRVLVQAQDARALEAELNVSPDITIPLPAPGDATLPAPNAPSRAARRGPRVRRELLERPAPPRRSGPKPSQESTARREVAAIKTTMNAAIADKARLLDESDAEKERLQGELAASKTEQAQLKARVEELTAELDRAVAARNSALAARDQALETAQRSVGERDTALQAQKRRSPRATPRSSPATPRSTRATPRSRCARRRSTPATRAMPRPTLRCWRATTLSPSATPRRPRAAGLSPIARRSSDAADQLATSARTTLPPAAPSW